LASFDKPAGLPWNKQSLVSVFRTSQAHQLRPLIDAVIQKRGLLMSSVLSATATFILSTKRLKALRQRLSVVRFWTIFSRISSSIFSCLWGVVELVPW
jgi:hypothetical protein